MAVIFDFQHLLPVSSANWTALASRFISEGCSAGRSAAACEVLFPPRWPRARCQRTDGCSVDAYCATITDIDAEMHVQIADEPADRLERREMISPAVRRRLIVLLLI